MGPVLQRKGVKISHITEHLTKVNFSEKMFLKTPPSQDPCTVKASHTSFELFISMLPVVGGQ